LGVSSDKNLKKFIYDSYGRSKNILSPEFKNKNWNDTDKKPEQDLNENNCGSRVLAWLKTAEKYSPSVVSKII